MNHAPRPLRTKFWTPGVVTLAFLMAAGAVAIVARYVGGIGYVTNLTTARPWGLWIGVDVASGVALAAGGFTTAFLAHIVSRHYYEPIVRPALLTAMLGYTFVVLGLLVDIGRSWAIWKPMIHWNPHSVLFEVAMCVMLYLNVLYIEFIPVVTERFTMAGTVTLLVGAGGIGKTTVLDGAVAAADDSLTIMRATATDLQVGVPFAVVADLGRFEAGRLAGVMRELAAVSGRTGPIDPFTNVLLVVDALADSLTTAAPAAIVIDDGQWIDAPSLTVLDRLLPVLSDVGASLTMAMRPDTRRDLASFAERARRHGGVSVDLGPLDEDAAIEILRRARPSADESDLAEIVTEAAGNPLFLTELAHADD